MSINILAILLSFAMMLAGVGGEGQPAEASKTLTLHDVRIYINDETLDLNPELVLGAYSDGQKGVLDLRVQNGEESLFPVQLGVDDSGLTALFEKSDVAVKVSADALNGLSDQVNQMMEGVAQQATESMQEDSASAELIDVLTNEYIPAYMGLLEAAQDPEYAKQIEEKGNAVFAQVIDRGEGTPVTEEIDGQEYALNEYSYTIEGDKMAELLDTLFASDEKLTAYYEAMFKMYSLMPEESGMTGISSYKDMFEKLHVDMTMEVEEKLSDDGEVDVMDAQLTFDMKGMVEAVAQVQEEADETASSDVPDLEPMVIDIQSTKVGQAHTAAISMDYEVEGAAMEMTANAQTDDGLHGDFDIDMEIEQEGERVVGMRVDARTGSAGGGETYDLYFDMNVEAEETEVNFHTYGIMKPDGTGHNTFEFDAYKEDQRFGIAFHLDVDDNPIEDKVNGHEAALTIDDLSQEALSKLGEDQALQGTIMQVAGSMMNDAQALSADESVQQLSALFAAMTSQPADTGDDYVDDSFDDAEETGEVSDYEYQEPVDDGELGFNEPEFTWLPDGMSVQSTDKDTQYDWLSVTIADDNYDNSLYVTFYNDNEDNAINYVVGGDGEIEAVDGREMTVTDYGDGGMSVTLRENGVYANLMFFGQGVDLETVGKIVSGIQF